MAFLPFVPFLDCAEVVMFFSNNATFWNLTLGMKYSGAVTLTELTALAVQIDAWWGADLRNRISTFATLTQIRCTGLTTATDPSYSMPPSATPDGALTGSPMPPSVCMGVTFQTALRGRSYRGRNFVAGRVQEELANEASWAATPLANMLVKYQALPAAVAVAGWSHVVLSRQLDGARRTVGASTPVTGYRANAPVATQRKRLV